MCTYATERVVVRDSGKTAGDWAHVATASVYVDHPYATPLEHTLNIDLFTDSHGRVASHHAGRRRIGRWCGGRKGHLRLLVISAQRGPVSPFWSPAETGQ